MRRLALRIGGLLLAAVTLVLSSSTAPAMGSSPVGAVQAKATLYSWGWNDYGQLALGIPNGPDACGTLTCSLTPMPAAQLGGFIPAEVTGGTYFGLAQGMNGDLYSFGGNANGELGTGGTTSSEVVTPVAIPPGISIAYGEFAAGETDSYAISTTGALYSWGSSEAGALGTCATTDADAPAQITLPSGVTAVTVAAGFLSAGAVGSDGYLYMWGEDNYGQLGDGTTVNLSCPEKVSLPNGVAATSVAMGEFYGLVIGENGHVYYWGNSQSGSTPQAADMPPGVRAVSVSEARYTGFMIGSDGDAYEWNSGDFSSPPAKVVLPAGVHAVQIASGGSGTEHAVLLGSDGQVYTWGGGERGQLGNGTTAASTKFGSIHLPGKAVSIGSGAYTGYAILGPVVPTAPTSLMVVPGNSTLKVSWATPASDGGSAITHFTASASNGTSSISCVTTADSCSFSKLVPSVPLRVTVTATNGVGTGPAASLPYAVYPVASKTLAIEVAAVVQVKTYFTLLAYGAAPGTTVTFGVPGSVHTCKVDPVGQCWTSARVYRTGVWKAVATNRGSSASSKFYAPLVKVPLQVRHGTKMVTAISSAPPGCSISEFVAGKTFSTKASSSGTATVRVKVSTVGVLSVTVTIDGTKFTPYSVDVT